jgi:hypothetical protein
MLKSPSRFPLMFQYAIDDSDPERVDVFNDLGVLVDRKITFVHHIARMARMLGIIK